MADGYERFVQWARRDESRKVLSEQEYNDRVGKFRIRLSPIEQEIRELEGKMATLSREFEATVKQLRARMAEYQRGIEKELSR